MKKLLFIFGIITVFITCKKPYEPPEGFADSSVLVVEGTINVGDNAGNIFKLSRLRTLQDTSTSAPEAAAIVSIVSGDGASYRLNEVEKGTYSANLSLNDAASYKVTIQTSNGIQYESALQPVINTPPIDSVTWKQPDDLDIYVHTHDPANNTRYFRWEYVETWANDSWFETTLDFVNGEVVTRPTGEQIHNCWSTDSSQAILIGNNKALSEDVISYQPITKVLRPSPKLAKRYSILVRQLGLTQEAYNFWSILQKNTELTGTLFDPQPSKMPTNLKCVSNGNNEVVGFVSVGKITEARIFILNSAMSLWPYPDQTDNCPLINKEIPDAIEYMKKDPFYVPVSYPTFGTGLNIASKICVDCRLRGGTNIKPSFW
ncbi:DUF4249 domain-containing protein [Flavihumibacter profundi]|uniref:DUF4249 domain-containing protein n=1 Tax=Flavihumibacter profundi TaxID=2716883 RepID=UPI001CC7E18F|nr:DUF4249 domain-containing protein [Flavihumibacter profundi]MBZ5858707.1 DUF4249 domain-containing protein [Flavihumibacter profundi]